jgi:hypothetical protein
MHDEVSARRAAALGLVAWVWVLGAARTALAEEGTPVRFPSHDADTGSSKAAPPPARPRDARQDLPLVAYTYSAQGAAPKTVGAYGYGLTLAAAGQDATIGGGATVWGSPIDRLTLVGDASSDVSGRFTPSVAAMGRFYGTREEGLSLSALAKWKAGGFGVGPHGDEIESELEGGILMTVLSRGFHLDSNMIAGGALGGSGEADVEGRIRPGFDVGRLVRVGLDGQFRVRVAGPKYLPSGRIWDFAAGAQTVVGNQNFFGAFTFGPSTQGVLTDAIGVTGVLAVGGTT